MTILWSFSYNSFVKFHGQKKNLETQHDCLFVCWWDVKNQINLSVMKGWVFLGWTRTKLGLMHLAQGHNTVTLWGSNLRPLGLKSRTLPLSHWAPSTWLCYIQICVIARIVIKEMHCTMAHLMWIWALLQENLRTTDVDQPAHLHRLISSFIILFLERIIPELVTCQISRFCLSL